MLDQICVEATESYTVYASEVIEMVDAYLNSYSTLVVTAFITASVFVEAFVKQSDKQSAQTTRARSSI